MQVLLGKLNIRKLCLSTIAMGLIVLICAVIIQAPIKGRAEAIADANYTITYERIDAENNVFGFTDGTTQLTQEQLAKIGISAQGDSSAPIITLNNVNFTTSADVALKIDSTNLNDSVIVEIKLVGENNITSTATNGKGIYGTKKLRFTGDGNLTVSGDSIGIEGDHNLHFNQRGTINATSTSGKAIYCPYRVTINSGTLNVTGYSKAIHLESEELYMYGGKLIARVTASESRPNTIDVPDLIMNDGSIEVSASANNSIAIFASTSVSFINGSIKITQNGLDVKGIRTPRFTMGDGSSNPSINVSGNIKAESGYDYHSCGIFVGNAMTVNSGQININLTNQLDTSKIAGINVEGTGGLTVHGGTITGRMNMSAYGNTEWYGDNIRVKDGAVSIDGGTLDLHTGGIGNGLHSTTGDINISDGIVKSSIYGTNSKAIYGETGINITGGSVDVFTEEDNNFGIYSGGTVSIGAEDDTDNIDTNIIVKRDWGNDSSGIYATSDMTIYEGNITIGKSTEYNFNNGIYVGGLLDIKSGTIISYGIEKGISASNLNISGGSITTEALGANNTRGIYVSSNLNISGGYIEAKANGNYVRGILVEGSGTTEITAGQIEVEVSGNFTKGIHTDGVLIVGTSQTEGPTINVKGDIQNTLYYNYDESGIFSQSYFTMHSGNINIDIKNTKATDINNPSNTSNNYIAGIVSKNGSSGGITINGGNLEINVDVEQPDGSFCGGDGLFTYGNITINGGRVISKTNGGVYWVTNNGNKVLYHSSGIDAKKDLTITGGEVQAINTNTSNTYTYTDSETSEEKTIYIGVGLYSDAQINITGGHIIAQGISRALAAESTSISSEVIQNGIITILASENYSGNPLEEYESAKNDSYEYVEIGVRHTYYLRYDVAAKNIFVGPEKEDGSDVSLGDDADEDDTNDTEDILASMGITIDAANDTLILNNAIIESAVQYGLYIEGNATIQLAEKSVSRITANNAVDNEVLGTIKSICGIYCTGALTIKGPGELIVSGYDQAIKVSETGSIKLAKATEVGTDYDMIPLKGGTSADGVNVVEYPVISDTSAWNSYKYVHIGKMPVYFFRFNSSEGQMYKVVGSTATPIDKNQVVYGWSISTDKTLTLDDFDFVTSASNAFEVVGTEEAKIKIMDNCSITTLYNSQSSYNGIYCSVATTFSGTGKLNLSKNAVAGTTYTGINAAEGVSFTGGTYNIAGEECGIYVASGKKYKVSNATIEASATSSSTSKGAIYIDGTPSEFVVDEKVQVSSDKTGTSPTLVKDYNISGYITYNTKPYIKIEPIVISVSITWGDMNYVGNNEWNPNDHSYSAKISPSTTTSGLIKVVNNSTSNVPVYAQVDVNMTNTYSITAALGGSITNGAKKMLNVGENMEDNLKLSAPQPLSDINDEVVGTVSVTLSDYRQ